MVRALLALCVLLPVFGCGTVTRGTKQGVKFQSEPPGAAVTVVRSKKEKTQWTCTAPCELQLSRKRDFDVTFELDGYKPVTGRLASRIGAKGGTTAIAGNAVLGGGIGFIVDAGTGANMQLKPDPMRAILASVDSDTDSMIPDVRVEGGGKETALSDESDSAPASNLKRLPRKFGANGVVVDDTKNALDGERYGVRLTTVDADGAASAAGLMTGDVIQKLDNVDVKSIDDINGRLATMKAGDTVSVILWRNNDQYKAKLSL